MLRRKLLTFLGSLVVLLLLVAVAAIWLLRGVLADMDHVDKQAMAFADDVNQLDVGIGRVEVSLYELQLAQEHRLDPLIDQVESLQALVDKLAGHYLVAGPEAAPAYRGIREQLPLFKQHVGAMATTLDRQLIYQHNRQAIDVSLDMRSHAHDLSELARAHVRAEQDGLIAKFRRLVLALGIVFLLAVNVSAFVLFRISRMVLRPVDRLVEASRQLALERFDHRVQLPRDDEFGELADAFNSLAEQLQANEAKRLDTLAQVAVTLNHELNNAIAIIELQLRLIGPGAEGSAAVGKPLAQIHESLQRMARTVESLKHVRRIVLTDYLAGVKMLDLERSTESEESAAQSRRLNEASVAPASDEKEPQ